MDFMLSRPERTLRGHEKAKELLWFFHPGRPAVPEARISPEIMEFTWKSAEFTILQELHENLMKSTIFTFPALRCAPAKTLHIPCKLCILGSDTLKVVCVGKKCGIW